MNEHTEHIPSPSVYPFTVAGGVTLGGMGLLTQALPISLVGGVFMIWGLFGWIQELRRGH